MQGKLIDLEKDNLLIYTNLQGTFTNYEWVPYDKFTADELRMRITHFNMSGLKKEGGQQVELITDKLVKEICAYKSRTTPYDDFINEFRELQCGVERTREYLETALDTLNRIGDLV
jgi:hypothetical protein